MGTKARTMPGRGQLFKFSRVLLIIRLSRSVDEELELTMSVTYC